MIRRRLAGRALEAGPYLMAGDRRWALGGACFAIWSSRGGSGSKRGAEGMAAVCRVNNSKISGNMGDGVRGRGRLRRFGGVVVKRAPLASETRVRAPGGHVLRVP